MKHKYPQIKPMGDRAILIEFQPEINEKSLNKLLSFKEIIEKELIEDKVEVINTYHSLLIVYVSTIENIYDKVFALKELVSKANIGKNINSQIFHIPVCYDEEFGLDLELISMENNLKIPDIIQLHTTPIYTVYFTGFLPGFLYLGGLDEKLQISRKSSPRMKVEKGAVGIGEKQTGIYPKTSPGGWQIIGNSPMTFFDKNRNPPCIISSGDKVKFYSVSKSQYFQISEEIKVNNFQLKREKYHG
ncbi:5-oxoprolinase subunit PxpB [Gillisia hiemivivida]|uniref:5-oxoprolinase subunit PxpB n=1 Tax=Gillisia hiemivivida TaxID=291190 RepID=A0A5C6ZYP3_9FLAO|nr:5-oxoprolinase subunit PxpB [Gillisia hiemivivida]TXD94515.1 5-oxoprolinase subunit PxpB [Gillisia hiemivivida]